MICPWCESAQVERRVTSDELLRRGVCLECGAVTESVFKVTVRNLFGMCKQNKKVTAIKLHRVATGADLKEAKVFIEELMTYM